MTVKYSEGMEEYCIEIAKQLRKEGIRFSFVSEDDRGECLVIIEQYHDYDSVYDCIGWEGEIEYSDDVTTCDVCFRLIICRPGIGGYVESDAKQFDGYMVCRDCLEREEEESAD